MNKGGVWRPRVTADISPETYYTLRKYIPSGQQKQILSFLIDDLAEMLKNDPAKVLTAILLRELGARGILKIDVKVIGEGKP